MKNPNTEALKAKVDFLRYLSKTANSLANSTDEVYDAKQWLDMCEEEVANTDEDIGQEETARCLDRLSRAKKSLEEMTKNNEKLEGALQDFKDNVEYLSTEVQKLTFDK